MGVRCPGRYGRAAGPPGDYAGNGGAHPLRKSLSRLCVSGFDDLLARLVNGSALGGLELLSHLVHGRHVMGRRLAYLRSRLAVLLPVGRDMQVDPLQLRIGHVRFAEVARIR